MYFKWLVKGARFWDTPPAACTPSATTDKMRHLGDEVDGAHGRGSPGAHREKCISLVFEIYGALEIVSFEV